MKLMVPSRLAGWPGHMVAPFCGLGGKTPSHGPLLRSDCSKPRTGDQNINVGAGFESGLDEVVKSGQRSSSRAT